MTAKYIISIDQSTSASKAFLIDKNGLIVNRYSLKHHQFYPLPGRVEHDASEIWNNSLTAISKVIESIPTSEIAAISISNQRETIIIWDKETSEPLCPVIVWQDIRGEEICHKLTNYKQQIFLKTGLPLSPYYSAAKIACLLEENPEIKKKVVQGKAMIGTVDSYLIYRLTGGKHFQTDVSNASRTQLMNLKELCWDSQLCAWFGISMACLPEILLSDGDFGKTNCSIVPKGIQITGVMGDSHAALFGQGCFNSGMAKATYGTGSSVMMNVGNTAILSQNGLSASVGFGFKGKVCYVLEGNVISSGDTLSWLQDEADWVKNPEEVEQVSSSIEDTGGVYFVPAFSGLGAPYFQEKARAIICGINRGTKRAHIIRAALESMAYQDYDIISAMEKDINIPLKELRVDGGPTMNSLLMQFQSDLLDCPVQCAGISELSAFGAAYMAGLSTGIFNSLEDIPLIDKKGRCYEPKLSSEQRELLLAGWRSAIKRTQFQP